MRKRFTIKPIGAEYSHPKFAGVNNALLFFFLSERFHFNPFYLPPPHDFSENGGGQCGRVRSFLKDTLDMMLPSLVCPCIKATNKLHSPLRGISPSRIGDLLKSMKGLFGEGVMNSFFLRGRTGQISIEQEYWS